MNEELLKQTVAGVLTLTLNRPERLNALTEQLNRDLLAALREAAEDSKVGAIVLTGSGKGFCAGRDVGTMAQRPAREATMEGRAESLRERAEISRLLHEMPKPTIAKVRGAAAGAGFSLALACDLRLAGATAKFTSSFIKVGLSGDYGAAYFLTALVGPSRAREILYFSPTLSAEDAVRFNLVNQVFSDDELDAKTQKIAEELASGPRVALGYMKRNLNAAEQGPMLSTYLDSESLHNARCTFTADHGEAIKAFSEKRRPSFTGT
ncbi:enoyl-CoA hydratase [Bradyrhizobium sp. dw_78]|uniref:enoyl-CoA hydratase n=1 Tax=Bradyrhizobium sp. dw_78 TaxID=2719793 RepID=UPI001BD2B75B|nr:enoyl-CoA hydratase [Bradyrhizobium sp. dw_78]